MQMWGGRLYATVLTLIGLVLSLGGGRLIMLGGSPYYLAAGIGLALSGVLLLAGRRESALVYLAVLIATVAWAIWEAGFDGWRLLPRLAGPLVLAIPFLVPRFTRSLAGSRLPHLTLVLTLAVVAVLVGAGLHDGMRKPLDPLYQNGVVAAPAKVMPAVSGSDTGDDWEAWGRDKGGTRFSPLTQLTSANVGRLEVAWTYRIGPDAKGKMPRLAVTPIKIGRTVYLCSAWNDVIALDAETGGERWRARSGGDTDPYGVCRGVTYYRVPEADAGVPCAERIITNTVNARLIALDAVTGRRCTDFGEGGVVSLLTGMGKVATSYYLQSSAPVIVRGRIVVGARVIDNQYWGEPSGVIRAFDAVTGKFAWAFDVGRPDRQGEPPEGETYTRSTPNSWAPMSADEELGLVYAPTGNATPDYFGGRRRPFDEKYSSATVAIDAETGKPRWVFQTLRHDIWDFDVASQPTLIDLPKPGGGVQRALIQPTKRGEIFVLDRATGQPIRRVENRRVPTAGYAPGERVAPTQPFSVGMPSLAGADLTERDMWGLSPLDQLWCRIAFRESRYEGTLTPPGLTPSIQTPSPAGGSNWGSVAIDTDRHILVANATHMATRVRLIPRDEADRMGLEPYDANSKKVFAGAGPQIGTPYAVDMTWFLSPLQMPCTSPPFGTMSGIDLATGKLVWTWNLGTGESSGPFGWRSSLPIPVGVPSSGGPMVTRGGLTFIAATQDNHFRAFDTRSGRMLWDAVLPAGGHAVPMTYRSSESGRQFVVIAASGFPLLRSTEGDYIVAYALPKKGRSKPN